MSYGRVIVLTTPAMVAFAGNSLLCRAALKHTSTDVASFTTIRLVSGAVMLWLVVQLQRTTTAGAGNWLSAFTLFVYAAGFSFAYISLPAGTGALLLFGAVQATKLWMNLTFIHSHPKVRLTSFPTKRIGPDQ